MVIYRPKQFANLGTTQRKPADYMKSTTINVFLFFLKIQYQEVTWDKAKILSDNGIFQDCMEQHTTKFL